MRKIVPTIAEIIESTTGETAASSAPFAHLAGAAPKAQDDDDNARAASGDDKGDDDDKDDKETKARKAKKAKAAEDDDDDKGDDDKKKEKDARRAERTRIHAILNCPGAARNRDYATYLAFETDIPEADAIGHVTHSVPKDYVPPKKDSLSDRMAGEPIPAVGAGGDTAGPDLSSSAAMAAAIIAAGKKRRGETA